MEELWKESNGKASPDTFRELVQLGNRIDKDKVRRQRIWIMCAATAVAALLAVVAAGSFSYASKSFDISPLDGTRSLVADYGSVESVTLDDGTKVTLNAGSSLFFPESFDRKNRIVYLSGEGSFSVARDPSRPFIVKTAYMDVQALGTSFSVQSYLGEKTVRTTLKEGKVKVDIPLVGDGPYYLDPDTQLVFTPATNSVRVDKVDAGRAMGWEIGYLSFSNASFPEVASVLERRFDVSISYNAESMRNNALNVRFHPDEDLGDILDVLVLLIPGSRYKIIENRVYWRF